MAQKRSVKKSAQKAPTTAKKTASSPKSVVRNVVRKKPAPTPPKPPKRPKPAVPSVPVEPVEVESPESSDVSVRKKGVRKATLTTGIRSKKTTRSLGRSRIPIDAPLDVVFQNDLQAREAFMFLGVHTIRELEQFHPDDLVMRLTSPAKQTVGRIRKILAMNNRCLEGDEVFALEFQERLSNPLMQPGG